MFQFTFYFANEFWRILSKSSDLDVNTNKYNMKETILFISKTKRLSIYNQSQEIQ